MLTTKQGIHSMVWAYRMLKGSTRPKELKHLSQWLSTADICFDVGAHAGAWSYPLSRLASHVYAFEALPYYAQILQPALRVAGAGNVTVLNYAVSNKRSSVSIAWRTPEGERLTGLTHVASPEEDPRTTVSVDSVSLDEFIQEQSLTSKRIRFLKCDVEGYECQVVEGATDLIRRCRPVIFAEAQNSSFSRYGKTSSDLIHLMVEHNYKATVFGADGNLSPIDANSYSGEGDILFCPN